MLSKSTTMVLGLISEQPINPYELTKTLHFMNVKWWYNIADSTVYTTIKNAEKKGLITGTVEKVGNMPQRTIYNITEKGQFELFSTLRDSILQFNFDTNIFSIAAFFIEILPPSDRENLLHQRIEMLNKYLLGITKQLEKMDVKLIPISHIANMKRMIAIVKSEILGTQELLNVCGEMRI